MVCKKENPSWMFSANRKIRPSGSFFGIMRQSLVMPNMMLNNDPWDGFFYPHLTPMNDSYILAYLRQDGVV